MMRRIMRSILFTLSAILLLAPNHGLAAESVRVHWKVLYTKNSAPYESNVPPQSYINKLHGCGFEPDLKSLSDLIPVSVLSCPGVLDFTASAQIRQRVNQRLKTAANSGGPAANKIHEILQKLTSLAFAIAPYGVYYSDREGLGSDRFVAINIARAHLVILNKAFWEELKSSADSDAFLLHESLGAMGYEDKDYRLSIQLFTLSNSSKKAAESDRILVAESGGASVIGRGGDPNQLFFKASLLRLAEKKLVLEGADPRLTPTEAELKRVINETPITVAPKSFFADGKNCEDLETGVVSRYTCGGFVLKAAGGKPFLLITQEWPEFSEIDMRKLLVKVFRQIVSELVLAKDQ